MPVFKEISADVTGHVPVKIWTDQIEASAEQQLIALAGCPFVVDHVAAMPDVHYGLGATIGSVFATRDVLLPTAVGVDIGCGMLAQPFDLPANELPASFLRDLHALIKRNIPTGFGQHSSAQPWSGFNAGRYTPAIEAIVRAKGPVQLGSLGGGNHFIELCQDEDGKVWLMLHSGSRGAGNMIAQHHIEIAHELNQRLQIRSAPDLWVLPLNTGEGQNYLRDMLWAQEYAMENRQRMRLNFVETFADLLRKRLKIDLAFDPAAATNIHHNYANREQVGNEQFWIHRKGATFAGPGVLGIIPGSMATGSYIVRGLGNLQSFQSCSHGAGRVMSRNQAERSISLADFAQQMRGIVAETSSEYLDEAPQAYKDLDTVIANQGDLVQPVRRLRPIMNVKGASGGHKGHRRRSEAEARAGAGKGRKRKG